MRTEWLAASLLLLLCACRPVDELPEITPPNILLIVADDLGYSDLGIYGGEIETPNLDRLARQGLRFSQFYAAAMCSPTRSMLLTGVDHHKAGMGNLVERLSEKQKGQPGYEGHLNQRVATLGEVLQANGYRTYMTGKWHLGSGTKADPYHRGFDRAFALLESGAGHFNNMLPLLGPEKAQYSQDGIPVESLPDDFYSSRFYVEKLQDYLVDENRSQKPFFAYLSFTAPHFPLQAPRESIDKYHGMYDEGYDAILAKRLQRMQQLGLVSGTDKTFPQLASQKPWDQLTPAEQQRQARLMEVYAGMIDHMDQSLGELIDFLKSRGEYDNTVIVFMSDNGAEGHFLRWGLDPLAPWAESCCDNSLENMGMADSYLMLGPDWARVATAPFRMFKGFTSDGGVRVPAFVHYPARFAGERVSNTLATVKDIMPTLLEIAGVESPGTDFQGREIEPMQGESMLALLDGASDVVHGEDFYIGWEAFGKRGIRQDNWKILWETEDAKWWDPTSIGIRRGSWQLYDLDRDPTELTDLSASEPQQLELMIRLWDSYVQENGVIIPDRQRGY